MILNANLIDPTTNKELVASIEVKVVNLMIFFDKQGFDAVSDIMKDESSWNLELINDIRDIVRILKKYETINNVYLVHHGRRYCKSGSNVSPKLFFYDNVMSLVLKHLISKEQKKPTLDTAEDYINSFVIPDAWKAKEETRIAVENNLIIYTYVYLLLNAIEEGGNYLSIACEEAGNIENLKILGSFVESKNINLYMNTNSSIIAGILKEYSDGNNKKYKGLGCFFRRPLSVYPIINQNGWAEYSTKNKTIKYLKKDLLLNNYLQNRESFIFKNFRIYTNNEMQAIAAFYSKKYKKEYSYNYSQTTGAYKKWKQQAQELYKDII